nr:S8 family serine peptidase [Eubacterium sp.]
YITCEISDEAALEGSKSLKISSNYSVSGYYFSRVTLDFGDISDKVDPGDYLGFAYYSQGDATDNVCALFDGTSVIRALQTGSWIDLYFQIPDTVTEADLSDYKQNLMLITSGCEDCYIDCVGIGASTYPFGYMSGTSMACPLVAGAVAVIAGNYDETGVTLANHLKACVENKEVLADYAYEGAFLDMSKMDTVKLGTDYTDSAEADYLTYAEEGDGVYENDLSFDSSTGDDPYLFDGQGDYEVAGPLVAGDGVLYYMPSIEQTEMQPGFHELMAYDIEKGSWSTLSALPDSVWLEDVSAVNYGGNLVVKGSAMDTETYDYPVSVEDPEQKVYVYDTAANTWTEASAAGVTSAQTLVNNSGELQLVGGGTGSYDSESDEWTCTENGTVVSYTTAAGAGNVAVTLKGAYTNPQVAIYNNSMYIMDENAYAYDRQLEKVTGSESELLIGVIPGDLYTASHTTVLENAVLVGDSTGLYLVGPANSDLSADTYVLNSDGTAFTAYSRYISSKEVSEVASCAYDGMLYAIGASALTEGNRLFRSTRVGVSQSVFTAEAKKTLSMTYKKKKATTFAASELYSITGAKGAVTFRKQSGDAKLTVASNGTVTVAKKLKVGSYTLKVAVTDAGNAEYESSTKTVTLTVNVTKAANTLKVTAKTKKVKASKLKGGKVRVKAVVAKNAVGKKTFTIKKYVTAKAKKYITINKKTGKIVLKKGTPKGTYKIKVKVKAAGNANYKKKTKTVTVKIKVK